MPQSGGSRYRCRGKNNNYWQKGKPKVKKLTFPAFPTNVQATYALINGEVDWAGNFIPAIDRIFVDKDPENHLHPFDFSVLLITMTLMLVIFTGSSRRESEGR